MNRSVLIGTVVGIGIATAAAGFAGYRMMDNGSTSAATLACSDVQVESQADPKDDHRIAGTVVGALVGGAVGKDVGNRGITTAAGAAIGALAGNQAQKKLQEGRTVTTTETRCAPR
ncbi:MAG: glycine zipper 2TM domain-containing protein [Gammaproteobacteria bacterium]